MYDIKAIYEAESVAHAVQLLMEHPQAQIIAGGSDVLVQIREGKRAGVELVSIYGLDELRGVSFEADGTIRIGSLTSFSHITRDPIIQTHINVLGQAVDQVGGPQIRNIGTIGGNTCNGVTSADSASTLFAWDAIIELTGPGGVRQLPIQDFYIKAGQVDLRPGELQTGILIPRAAYEGYQGHYIKYAMRNAMNSEGYLEAMANLDLIPAEDHLAGFSRHIYTQKINNPFQVLQRLLEPVERNYDFVFIDVGPSLGDLMINAMVYVDQIYIPVDAGDLALDAMIRFMEFVDESRAEGHTNAVIAGVVLTMRDSRSKYEREISDGLRETFGDLVMKTEVRRLVKIKEMSSYGVDVEKIADYIDLTEELLGKGNKE